MSIGGHALHAEEQRGTQRDDVRLALPELQRSFILPAQLVPLVFYPADEIANGVVVKVHVGQRGKQSVDQQTGNFFRACPLLSGRFR